MTGAEIATLIQVVAPIAERVIVKGLEVTTIIKADVTQDQLQQSLELSKSANWPKLTFGASEP